jgi:hypothetical protein
MSFEPTDFGFGDSVTVPLMIGPTSNSGSPLGNVRLPGQLGHEVVRCQYLLLTDSVEKVRVTTRPNFLAP